MKPITIPEAIATVLYGPKQAFLYKGVGEQTQKKAIERILKRSGAFAVMTALEAVRSVDPARGPMLDDLAAFIGSLTQYSPFAKVTFDEFVELAESDSGSTILPVQHFTVFFGVTEDELLGELRSGRLKATGTPTDQGFVNIAITGPHLVEWLKDPGDPKGVKFKAMGAFKEEGRPN